jgi:hypothetical protein
MVTGNGGGPVCARSDIPRAGSLSSPPMDVRRRRCGLRQQMQSQETSAMVGGGQRLAPRAERAAHSVRRRLAPELRVECRQRTNVFKAHNVCSWLGAAIPAWCGTRPLPSGNRPLEPRMSAFPWFGGFTLSSRRGDPVARKAEPDPEPKFAKMCEPLRLPVPKAGAFISLHPNRLGRR